jgi:RNA polymerase sigma factor (sigma-70 family)
LAANDLCGETEFTRAQEYQALRQYLKLAERQRGHITADRLNAALAADLTPRQMQLVRMYYIDQMLMSDIAATLGLDLSTVSRTIKRGRERLRRSMRYGGRTLLSSAER